jgi:hypothetical protein
VLIAQADAIALRNCSAATISSPALPENANLARRRRFKPGRCHLAPGSQMVPAMYRCLSVLSLK